MPHFGIGLGAYNDDNGRLYLKALYLRGLTRDIIVNMGLDLNVYYTMPDAIIDT